MTIVIVSFAEMGFELTLGTFVPSTFVTRCASLDWNEEQQHY